MWAAFEMRLLTEAKEALGAEACEVAAEHGVGRIKTGWLRVMRSPEEYEAMRSVKTLFDPENRLNPGVLFDS